MAENVKKNRFSPKNIVSGIARFFREFKSEIKKISWPTRKTVAKNTMIVLVICAIVGAIIWIADAGLIWLMDFVLR